MWQHHATKHVADLERWIFGGKAQALWPYRLPPHENSPMCILYPDMFEDLGLEEECDADNGAAIDPRWKDVSG